MCLYLLTILSPVKKSRKEKRKEKQKAKHDAELEEMAKEGNFSVSQQESRVTDQILEGITDIKVWHSVGTHLHLLSSTLKYC